MDNLEQRLATIEALQSADRGAILALARLMAIADPRLVAIIPKGLMVWADHCRTAGDELGATASEALADQLVRCFPASGDQ